MSAFIRAKPAGVIRAIVLTTAATVVIPAALSRHPAAAAQTPAVTRQEMLRGSITPEREWWDVIHYDLHVRFFPDTKTIAGSNVITFKTLAAGSKMQIDLQPPLAITKIRHGSAELKSEREGNVYWVWFDRELPQGVEDSVEIVYEGTPVESKNPPWVGGITWGRDDLGEHFISTTCEGIGASIWWPNKDIGYDEPDRGMRIGVTVPEHLVGVSNGRLVRVDSDAAAHTKTFRWEVSNPINNYGVNVNIGNYTRRSSSYDGLGGALALNYWVLPHQRAVAERQFKEVPRMLAALEHWFGRYPWYEDGYKLVAVSYPGMEHQSSVTYGNWFRNGYRGRDVSFTGIGQKFDFIIVHESAHEWFGNNVSMRDVADMWIHEAFANYAENLFVEYYWGKKLGEDYVVGSRRNVKNDTPIIGTYGANREGSGDMYYKGGNMLHTIRQLVDDDEKWRAILTGLNTQFWHQTVTTKQIERYIAEQGGIDLSKVFDQYLRTPDLPLLSYKADGGTLSFKYEKVVDGFAMPVRVLVNSQPQVLTPTAALQIKQFETPIASFVVDRNFYVNAAEMK